MNGQPLHIIGLCQPRILSGLNQWLLDTLGLWIEQQGWPIRLCDLTQSHTLAACVPQHLPLLLLAASRGDFAPGTLLRLTPDQWRADCYPEDLPLAEVLQHWSCEQGQSCSILALAHVDRIDTDTLPLCRQQWLVRLKHEIRQHCMPPPPQRRARLRTVRGGAA